MRKLGLKLVLAAASFAGLLATTSAAYADVALSGYVALTSDYRFRGISQNDLSWAPQGSINATIDDGWYVGAWASKINWVFTTTSYELDLYGGKHFDLGGTDLNLEAYYYAYPDNPGGVSASYFEGIAQVTHSFDKLTLMGSLNVSPDFSFETGTSVYLAGTATYAINDWLSVSGNLGHQWVNSALPEYTYADIGATASYANFSLDLRYSGTDMGVARCAAYMGDPTRTCKGGFVATLTYNFADLLHPFK
ncbi:MAG: hypothetical protein JO294_10150 [Alphaproteobacteria bacterium]|nr:hypothetical protein [Alphaproteobacteria bacterium]